MKTRSTSPASREMQGKTTSYHYVPNRVKINIRAHVTCWWECREARLLGMKVVQPLWKRAWLFLSKLNMHLPYNSATVALGIDPREVKTDVHTKTCTWMFREALWVIGPAWKQPKWPSTGEWLNKLGHFHTRHAMLCSNKTVHTGRSGDPS